MTDGRELLKQATSLKREGRIDDAVAMLRRAYATPTDLPLMIEERLRLPMYLQLAGRADEGWREMNLLNVTYVDQFSQATIANQMAVFSRKEGNHRNAILFSAWAMCKERERDLDTLGSMIDLANRTKDSAAEWRTILPGAAGEALAAAFTERQLPVTGTTPDGIPIRDVGYPVIAERLKSGFDEAAIRSRLDRDLKKLGAADGAGLVKALAEYLRRDPPYEICAVRDLCICYLG